MRNLKEKKGSMKWALVDRSSQQTQKTSKRSPSATEGEPLAMTAPATDNPTAPPSLPLTVLIFIRILFGMLFGIIFVNEINENECELEFEFKNVENVENVNCEYDCNGSFNRPLCPPPHPPSHPIPHPIPMILSPGYLQFY